MTVLAFFLRFSHSFLIDNISHTTSPLKFSIDCWIFRSWSKSHSARCCSNYGKCSLILSYPWPTWHTNSWIFRWDCKYWSKPLSVAFRIHSIQFQRERIASSCKAQVRKAGSGDCRSNKTIFPTSSFTMESDGILWVGWYNGGAVKKWAKNLNCSLKKVVKGG